MNSFNARFSEPSPNKISLERHSALTDRTHRSANAFRFGLRAGQGLATDKQNAHGKVDFWQEPLLPKDYIRASCGRCHKEGEVPGVPELAEGRRLFETQGCRGCHKLSGVGGTVGPDLTEEGAVHRSPEWLERHFLEPNKVSRNSPMPNFHFTKQQARALTFYMLSLTNEQMGTYYSSVRLIPSAGYGRQLFIEKNCIACHNIGGVGAKNGPDLLGVAKEHSPGWLDERLVNPQLIYPGSIMPAYDLETQFQKGHHRLHGLSHRRRCTVDPVTTHPAAYREGRRYRGRQAELRPLRMYRLPWIGTAGKSAQSQQPGRRGSVASPCLRRLHRRRGNQDYPVWQTASNRDRVQTGPAALHAVMEERADR